MTNVAAEYTQTTYAGLTMTVRTGVYFEMDRQAVIDGHDDYYLDKLNIPAAKNVIDIGAHLGGFTCRVHHINPCTKIIAVEPEPDNYHLLNMNAGGFPEVIMYRAALFERDCKPLYARHVWNSGANAFIGADEIPNYPADLYVIKPADTQWLQLGYLMNKHHMDEVDILKIDCEGAEFDVLANCPEETLCRCKIIVGEAHDLESVFWDKIGDRLTRWFSISYRVFSGSPTRGVFLAVRR